MKNKIELWWEKLYPHIFGAVIVVLLSLVGFSPMKSSGINNLIDGIVMLDSIIIGFIGAVIPVVLSMKNESKFVKYVFENDRMGLFKRSISETICYGLADVSISLLVYIKDAINNKFIKFILAKLLIYFFVVFITSTYRSMSCMLKLIFSRDKDLQETKVESTLPEERKRDLWNKKGR